MYLILRAVLFAIAVMVVSWVVPGISVTGFLAALIVSVVFGLVNAVVKPVIYFIAIPINVLTLGLFSFVINAFLLWLVGHITPGFSVSGFWAALIGSILLALLGVGINSLVENDSKFSV